MGMSHYQEDFQRLEDLHSYRILDSDPETSFDQLTFLASSVCNTPIALVSFIDKDRQWFKSSIGLDPHELPRHLSACNETINRESGCFEIKDTHVDDSLHASFMKDKGFRYYGGVAIHSGEGHSIGTLCVIDYVPRSLNEEQFKTLKVISRQITDLLELRKEYQKNLERLQEISEASYRNEWHIQDITHKASMRAMAEVAAGVSYRIHSHVYNIYQAVNRLSKVSELSREVATEVDVIRTSTENISSILQSLKKFVSAEKEKGMKPVDFSDIVQRVLNHLEYRFKDRAVNLEVNLDPEIRTIGHYSQLMEAVFALVSNALEAVEHMKEKKVEVSLKTWDHRAILKVKDSGRGVSDTVRPFIFQPFFTTKSSSHIGTGLSLAQALIHRHGGDIKLEKCFSPTIFSLELPMP